MSKRELGDGEPSPSPDEPDAFQKAWGEYNKAGLSTGWEKVGFVGGFKHGFDAGRESTKPLGATQYLGNVDDPGKSMEIAVNYEFTQMLKALQSSGFFGDNSNSLDCLVAIQAEVGKRLYAIGQSAGATYEAERLKGRKRSR